MADWPVVMLTGHRAHKTVAGRRIEVLTPEQCAWVERKLNDCAVWLRDECGTTTGVSGMALDSDTYWARAVLAAGLDLHAVVPFPQQADPWPEPDRIEWRRLISLATTVTYVGDLAGIAPADRRYEAVRLLHVRNDRMIAISAAAVCVLKASVTSGGTWSCVGKAVRRGLPRIHLEPETRSITVQGT